VTNTHLDSELANISLHLCEISLIEPNNIGIDFHSLPGANSLHIKVYHYLLCDIDELRVPAFVSCDEMRDGVDDIDIFID